MLITLGKRWKSSRRPILSLSLTLRTRLLSKGSNVTNALKNMTRKEKFVEQRSHRCQREKILWVYAGAHVQ